LRYTYRVQARRRLNGLPWIPQGNAYYRHRQEAALARQPARRRPRNLPGLDVPAFELPPGLADADTIGVIYDETDGLNFYPEYGMLRDLFGNPALAADKR
jgi:hypothetical protein